MKAIILAGGEGTRLHPMTENIPKPMIPFFGGVLMDHIIAHLRANGVTDICATLGHLPDSIRQRYGNSISYSTETTPLGTAGSVAAVPESFLQDSFIVISGDAVCDFDLSPAIQRHRGYDAAVTIITCRHRDPRAFGLVLADNSSRVTDFLEKPRWCEVFTDLVSTGIYIISPRVLEYVPRGEKFDFSKDLFPLLLNKGETICAFECAGYWRDVGTPKDYLACCKDVLDGKVHLPLLRDCNFSPVLPDVHIVPPCFISPDSTVGKGSVIGPYSVLQNRVSIGANSRVLGGVLTGTITGTGFSAEHCIISHNAAFGHNCSVKPMAVVGECAKFPDDSTVPSGRHSGVSSIPADLSVQHVLDLGISLGKGLTHTVICHSGGERCRILAAIAAGGAASTGCDVTTVVCGHICAARYLTHRLRADASLFIEDLGTQIRAISMDGHGMPKSLSSTPFSPSATATFGRLEKVSNGDESYLALGNGRNLSNLRVYFGGVGNAADTARRMVCSCGAVLTDKPDGTLSFFIGDHGEISMITDEAGAQYSASQIWAILLTALYLSGKRTLAIPEYVNLTVQEYILRLGAKLLVLNRDTSALDVFLQTPELNDGILAALFLCEYLKKEGISMAEFASDIPRISTLEIDVPVTCGRSGAMGRLSALPHAPSRRGLFFHDKKGEVRIIPRSTTEQLRILVSAQNTETARELCDFYRRIVEK